MKKILITGANSYIGTSFEKYIKEKFANQYCVDTVDVIDQSWREKDFSGYDVIYHVAGIAHIREKKKNKHLYYDVNRDLTIEIAKKAKADGVSQFIIMSSMSVYGMTMGHITKNTVPKPNTAYGDSKLQADEYLRTITDEKFRVAILRPPMVYGKGSKGNFPILEKLAKKLPVFPKVNNQRSMLYIGNLVEFVRLMIENEEEGIFWPQNAEYSNTSELVKMIAGERGKKIILVQGFGWVLKLMSHFTGLVNKAFGNLVYEQEMSEYKQEYQSVTLAESIKETIK